mmetsp:Transcript_45777/g.127011  ORF Transcript_45777/g.127011 Transcript_45777/m.127011 type:complete len:280 (+) Transcript_45777:349-1188(+)
MAMWGRATLALDMAPLAAQTLAVLPVSAATGLAATAPKGALGRAFVEEKVTPLMAGRVMAPTAGVAVAAAAAAATLPPAAPRSVPLHGHAQAVVAALAARRRFRRPRPARLQAPTELDPPLVAQQDEVREPETKNRRSMPARAPVEATFAAMVRRRRLLGSGPLLVGDNMEAIRAPLLRRQRLLGNDLRLWRGSIEEWELEVGAPRIGTEPPAAPNGAAATNGRPLAKSGPALALGAPALGAEPATGARARLMPSGRDRTVIAVAADAPMRAPRDAARI